MKNIRTLINAVSPTALLNHSTVKMPIFALIIGLFIGCGGSTGFTEEGNTSFQILEYYLQHDGENQDEEMALEKDNDFNILWTASTKESHSIEINIVEPGQATSEDTLITSLTCGQSLHNGCDGNEGFVECRYNQTTIECSADDNANWTVSVTENTTYNVKLSSCKSSTSQCSYKSIELALAIVEEEPAI